jgi:hypothetical protein
MNAVVVDNLDTLAGELVQSYLGDERARRIAHRYLPSRERIVEILESVLDLMYPGDLGAEDRARNGALPVLRAGAGVGS